MTRRTDILVADEQWRKEYLAEEQAMRARVLAERRQEAVRMLGMRICAMQGNRINLGRD